MLFRSVDVALQRESRLRDCARGRPKLEVDTSRRFEVLQHGVRGEGDALRVVGEGVDEAAEEGEEAALEREGMSGERERGRTRGYRTRRGRWGARKTLDPRSLGGAICDARAPRWQMGEYYRSDGRESRAEGVRRAERRSWAPFEVMGEGRELCVVRTALSTP